ncbi:MAG: Nif11-like leader peptide family natural product precursor [Chloroflexi bacterium]|nr:Nif11-like leader peptide family natural product precursor [Chloroflexota bacterium]
MPLEIAKQFLKKAQEDDALHQRLSAVEGDRAAAVKLGAELGFSFTAEELQTASDELYGDVSDDDLAAAAGGQSGLRPPIIF